jgi:hypothetical protein
VTVIFVNEVGFVTFVVVVVVWVVGLWLIFILNSVLVVVTLP